MPTIAIDEKGCRACNLCVEVCPTEVLAMSDGGQLAKVVRQEDCIGCTSCVALCPSRCIDVTDTAFQRPFYRIEENERLIERFLQRKPVSRELGPDDWAEAQKDISVRLLALADSVTETMGRGQKAAGRKAGGLAAAHLPEMYEASNVGEVLAGMKRRFAGSFDFEPTASSDGSEIAFRFSTCALAPVVASGQQKVGEGLLCTLFHEYWAGLLGAFTNNSYTIDVGSTTDGCTITLHARR